MTWLNPNIPYMIKAYNDYNMYIFITFTSRNIHDIHNHKE